MQTTEKKSIFIGGCPRSGTTLLGSILGSTESTIVTPESHFKQTIANKIKNKKTGLINAKQLSNELNNSFRFSLWNIDTPAAENYPEELEPCDYRDLIYDLVTGYQANNKLENWSTWIDHTPQNLQNVKMLLEIFPEAKFIHIIRDPRGTASSILPLDWGPNDAKTAAYFWLYKLSFGLAAELSYPDKVYRVHYEDLVQSPRKTVEGLCKFCSISFIPEMLEGKNFIKPEYTKRQHLLVGGLPDTSKIESWKNKLSDTEIFTIESITEDLLHMTGYHPENRTPLHRNYFRKLINNIKDSFARGIKKIRFNIRKKYFHYKNKLL